MAKLLQLVPYAAGWGLIAVVAAAIGVAVLESPRAKLATTGDDWRRTAIGWERSGQWPVGFTAYSFATKPTQHHSGGLPRHDTHPSVLALVQLVGVLLSLYFFPPFAKHSTAGTRLPALIRQSFRASAFGS